MITALPSALRSELERVERTIAAWPINVTIDNALRWILQFEAEDYSLAVRVIENLDVLGSHDVRSALEVANVKLMRRMAEKGTQLKGDNTLYAGIGNAAKSGAMMAYQYRMAASISEDNFLSGEEEEELDFSNVENIVLVDDVIGTGHTVADEVRNIVEEVYTLAKSRNVFVLTVAGYQEGIQHIVKETGASVICALTYTARDTVSALDASFYDGIPVTERAVALEKLRKYCRSISTSQLGFGNVGGLLVFDHNTPNTSLPIIWHRGKSWSPLFPRATRIRGTAKVLKGAAKERARAIADAPAPIVAAPSARDSELTLFVEGRLDELFVDHLRTHHGLAAHIGVADINAVALGGLYQSERLLSLLRETRKHAIFVLDAEEHSRRVGLKPERLGSVNVQYLKPSFTALLDVDKLYASRDRFQYLPERTGPTDDPIAFYHELERALFKRGSIASNAERITQIIDEFLDPGSYDRFVTELNENVKRLFAVGEHKEPSPQ